MAAKKTKTERARLERPSPTAHAADHKGEVKRGHDGKRWISEPDRNGVYHWKHVKRTRTAVVAATSAMSDAALLKRRLHELRKITETVGDERDRHHEHLAIVESELNRRDNPMSYDPAQLSRQDFDRLRVYLMGRRAPDAPVEYAHLMGSAPGPKTCHHCHKPITQVSSTSVVHHPGKPDTYFHTEHLKHR